MTLTQTFPLKIPMIGLKKIKFVWIGQNFNFWNDNIYAYKCAFKLLAFLKDIKAPFLYSS